MIAKKPAIALAKKLVALPSYVDKQNNETAATDFLVTFLRSTFPTMSVEKQYLYNSSRYNIILRGKGIAKLFVLGHIDTVQPKEGWITNPLVPSIKADKLYGLGAADMKSSLAAFLCALEEKQKNISLDNLLVLIYVDEEYDFLGIRHFLQSTFMKSLAPAFTLSLDGELAIASGCRGLVELHLTFRGQSGHAASPAAGINAITESIAILNDVSRTLSGFHDDTLGPTTTNIAYIHGGVVQRQDGQSWWSQEGNVIADTAQIIFEARPSISTVNAKYILKKIRAVAKAKKLTITNVSVRHDIAPWSPAEDEASLQLLKEVYAKANVSFALSDRKHQGYIDVQMVAERILSPIFIIGTGGENKHAANENVPLVNIEQATRVYGELLRKILL